MPHLGCKAVFSSYLDKVRSSRSINTSTPSSSSAAAWLFPVLISHIAQEAQLASDRKREKEKGETREREGQKERKQAN